MEWRFQGFVGTMCNHLSTKVELPNKCISLRAQVLERILSPFFSPRQSLPIFISCEMLSAEQYTAILPGGTLYVRFMPEGSIVLCHLFRIGVTERSSKDGQKLKMFCDITLPPESPSIKTYHGGQVNEKF